MINWKTIEGTGGRYEVSESGVIWDYKLNKEVPQMKNGNYMTVNIRYTTGKVLDKVHRLVAEYFCEKPLRAFYVEHKDENLLNNHYTNLEWKTPLIFGVGYNQPYKGEEYNLESFTTWKNMIQRCYDTSFKYYGNYGGVGVYVDSMWHDFRVFEQWHKNQLEIWKEVDVKLELDKDTLSKTSLKYSPDSCLLLPRSVNQIFRKVYYKPETMKRLVNEALTQYSKYLPVEVLGKLKSLL